MGLKELLSGFLKKIAPLGKLVPIHPNVLTLFSIIFALFATFVLYKGDVLLAAVLVGIAYLMDAADGIVARARRLESTFGAYFDGVSDRLVDFFVLLAMMRLAWPYQEIAELSLIISMSFGVFLTTFAVAYADHRGAVEKKDLKKLKCIFERPERCVAILLALVLYAYSPLYSFYVLVAIAALSVVAFLQRFTKAAEINLGY